MGCSNNIIQNISFQMKNIEIQFNNFLIQTQNFGLQNTICQTQDLGFQMINIGIQLLDIFTSMSNNIDIFMIKQQISNMITQMQNIDMKISIGNENVMENSNMMMQIPDMMNEFENNNSMGDIMNSNENINLQCQNPIKYNVTFLQQTGTRTLLILDEEKTIKEMVRLYSDKIGIELDDMKERKFMYNGDSLNLDSNQNIKDLFKLNFIPLIHVI